jgi:TrmH family RNA methyltransferase
MIESRDNARLKQVRKLLSGRKHREETGLFACEGEDLVDAARVAGIEEVDLLSAGENVVPELLASVSTLPHPARVIGVYRRDDLPRDPRPVCLGLWHVADPGNVGTLVRTADAFGACVALSGGCADPLGPKALRASMGAVFRVPIVPWDDVPGTRVALVAHGGTPLAELPLEPPLTFLLGAERAGLPAELVTQCHKATIELPGGAESLNVAAAGAIALYELGRRASFD